MTQQNDSIALVGRILIAVLFLTSGIGKLADPAAALHCRHGAAGSGRRVLGLDDRGPDR